MSIGAKGVYTSGNTPGAMGRALGLTHYPSGDLFLWAYHGVWRFQVSTNMWAWISGNTTDWAGVYNNPGTTLQSPSSRNEAIVKGDANGNAYLFDGYRETSMLI